MKSIVEYLLYPSVAQLVEQLPFKQMVGGSSPPGRTLLYLVIVFLFGIVIGVYNIKKYSGVAQW